MPLQLENRSQKTAAASKHRGSIPLGATLFEDQSIVGEEDGSRAGYDQDQDKIRIDQKASHRL